MTPSIALSEHYSIGIIHNSFIHSVIRRFQLIVVCFTLHRLSITLLRMTIRPHTRIEVTVRQWNAKLLIHVSCQRGEDFSTKLLIQTFKQRNKILLKFFLKKWWMENERNMAYQTSMSKFDLSHENLANVRTEFTWITNK